MLCSSQVNRISEHEADMKQKKDKISLCLYIFPPERKRVTRKYYDINNALNSQIKSPMNINPSAVLLTTPPESSKFPLFHGANSIRVPQITSAKSSRYQCVRGASFRPISLHHWDYKAGSFLSPLLPLSSRPPKKGASSSAGLRNLRLKLPRVAASDSTLASYIPCYRLYVRSYDIFVVGVGECGERANGAFPPNLRS